MSFQLPSSSRTSHTRPAWSGMALVVEAMVLLLVLVGSLAVITQLFATASARAQSGRKLAQAVALATTEAERFAADPANSEGTFTEDDLSAFSDVKSFFGTDGYDSCICLVCKNLLVGCLPLSCLEGVISSGVLVSDEYLVRELAVDLEILNKIDNHWQIYICSNINLELCRCSHAFRYIYSFRNCNLPNDDY